MGKILASLDIGTNSTLFLLAEKQSDGRISPIHHDVRTNDLGRGLGSDGNLTPETIELNLRLLRDFRDAAQQAGAAEIRIAATEALRRAGNAEVLIGRADRELGLHIRVISGEQEAALTFQGILSGMSDPAMKIIAADIGGGSSEVVHGEGGKLLEAKSLPVGAVSMDRRHIRHDPPQSEEIEAVRAEAYEVFRRLPDTFRANEADLVICGGTASSLAAADLELVSYQPEKIAGHVMTREGLELFIHQFSQLSLEERRRIPGIGLRRAEIILPGTILISELLRVLGRRQYLTSERGLRYGLLVE